MASPKRRRSSPLSDARRQLDYAISALIDPKPQHTGTRIVWLDSLYDQLREAVPGTKRDRTGIAASQPPAWIDALDLLREIDATVAHWEPSWPQNHRNPAGLSTPVTILRLRAIQSRKWRPHDVADIHDKTGAIRKWAERITNMLTDTPVKHLPAACPACGKKTIYRHDSAGELVRQPALQITTAGCVCQHCRTTWGPERFLFLAKVLGYELPAGVLE
ncbi:DUF7341 domain-containing protein [Mycobacterium botniense]|uniref:Uncharacterized protein n=1 Tax=Mycobacterium botniense TaxID=84962 RepID=A0A7I9XY59_9MYCO|nr:hypothetical protein [Mycobacterium botniense]GFG74739.1 hypothetical protein MBOT_21040 [Mycobacterium botniense]